MMSMTLPGTQESVTPHTNKQAKEQTNKQTNKQTRILLGLLGTVNGELL